MERFGSVASVGRTAVSEFKAPDRAPWESIAGRLAMPLHGVTVFLSAFLVFQIQPIVGKILLPSFGGTAAVWGTCLLFFQVTLLAGYAYAHLLTSRFGRSQTWVHVALLIASLTLLPVRPDPGAWRVDHGASPAWNILLLLAFRIGLPCLMLAATGPLLQGWFARSFPARSPYRLYAVSNIGSPLALMSYPVVVEPILSRDTQGLVWSMAYIALVLVSSVCALGAAAALRGSSGVARESSRAVARPAPVRLLAWLALSGAASALLMATTNQLSLDLVSLPLLWVLPLALYLVTFILCFGNERWYNRRLFGSLLVLQIALAVLALRQGIDMGMGSQALIHCGLLFTCCMVCHGELVRIKPSAEQLTLFYLVVAAGGALGGIGVGLVAPAVLNGFGEYHVALLGCFTLSILCWYFGSSGSGRRGLRAAVWCALLIAQIALAFALLDDLRDLRKDVVASRRNFYGVLRVVESPSGIGGGTRVLWKSRIKHGAQYLDPRLSGLPTTYYGADSGIGLGLAHHPRRAQGPLVVGVVGLGVGTIASHGRTGDTFRFWEINPGVLALTREYFTYLSDSRATTDVVLGDARIRMQEELERLGGARYDVLAVDAFCGDAVPAHLLTAECADMYWSLLKPDGLLLLHISNRFVNLVPVARALANHSGAGLMLVGTPPDRAIGTSASLWAILFRGNAGFLGRRAPWASPRIPLEPDAVLWTDDVSSLWPVLKLR